MVQLNYADFDFPCIVLLTSTLLYNDYAILTRKDKIEFQRQVQAWCYRLEDLLSNVMSKTPI